MKFERRRSDLIVTAGGAVAAALGGLALAGWAFGLPFLADFGSRNIPMAPSTALLFVLYGLPLAFAVGPFAGPRVRVAAIVAASIGGAVAATLLFAGLLGVRPMVEHLGFAIGGEVEGAAKGHMSPVTACGFLMSSVALAAAVLAGGARGWRARVASIAAAVLVSAGGLLMLAYIAGEPFFYGGTFIPPAATTSGSFVAMGMGVLALARPRERSRERIRLNARAEATLVGLFLALATGVILTGAAWFRGQDRRFRDQVGRQISAIAGLKVGEIDLWRSERLGDGRVLQGNVAFLRLARGVLDDTSPPGETGVLEGWLERIRQTHEYEEIQLLAPDGSPRLTAPRGGAPPCAELRRRTPEVLESGETAILDLHLDRRGGPVHMGVVVPLLDEVSRATIGAVFLSIDPGAFLYPFVSRWPGPSRSAETLLVRKEGEHALFLNDPRFAPGTALSLRVPLSRRDVPGVRAALGEEGVELGTDYRGVRVLAATRVVPGSPWGLVARIDVAEAYAPLRERLWLTVLLMGGLVLTVGAGVGAVWRRELTKLERARRVAEAERDWLRDVIERSLNEIFVVDPDSLRFLFVNRGAVRNLGYSEEELHGLTPLDIAPELTEASLRERLRTASSRRGQVHRFETTHRRKDGTDYPVEVHLQFVGTALGDFFLAVIDDITERHLAEARIRHLNRVYSVLSEVNQAIVRIRDPLALCREACRIAVEEGGFCEAQLSLRVAGSESLRLVAKVPAGTETSGERASGTEASPCPGLALEALRTGRHVVSDLPVEERLPSAPDDSLAASGTRSAAALPLVVEGEPAGALVLLAGEAGFFDEAELHLLDEMAMDIGFALETGRREAARREAEASLARSEKRFRAVARLSADFSYSCVRSGARGLIVDWITDAFFSISGYTEAELGETGCWMSFVHPEDREAAMEPLGRLKAGEADSREFRIVTRDGSVRWLLNRMECEEDASAPGGLRIFGAVQDVSRSRQAELAIRQLNSDLESRVAERTSDLAAANKELETFAYSVAHDLRAPLRAIDGYSQILLEEHSVVLNDQGRGYLGKVRRSAQRMAQLVDALLSYSRIERRSLQTESVDVVDVVRSVLGEMQEEIQGQRAELAVDMDRLVVRADREGLAVVLRNLVSNALKYSRGALPPRIEVGGRTEDGMIRFWVRDNGIGFDMTYHDRIFEIFQRLHHVEDFAGTGIGLALVKKAVDRMKGRVWAESAPGRGATFFVELPG